MTRYEKQRPAEARASRPLQLTGKQLELVRLIEYRRVHGVPTVQRDLAEALGIRRDSLNKLLARARRRLHSAGRELAMPPRHAAGRVALGALAEHL